MEYFQLGGLVTKNDPNTENCNLFYAEWLTLRCLGVTRRLGWQDYFIDGMDSKWNLKTKCYNRRTFDDSRSVSHDEITGWLVSSKILYTTHGENIWKHLITHFGSYNNTSKMVDYLPFNPANYYAWGLLVNSRLAYIFAPFYLINLLISANKPPENTSSKIIYWVQLSNTHSPLFKKYFEYKMKKMYGEKWLASLLIIYFGKTEKDDFPIFQALKEFYVEPV